MSRSTDAAAYCARTGETFAAASRLYRVSAESVRAAMLRLGLVRRMPALELALALVAAGEASTRRAAAVYGLRAEDVLAAWNERNPGKQRVWA